MLLAIRWSEGWIWAGLTVDDGMRTSNVMGRSQIDAT